jgi:hypothetical protein
MRTKARILGSLLLLAAFGCSSGRKQEARVPSASVTVYPVVLGTQTSPEVTQTVAVLLERGGLTEIELAPAPFETGAAASFDERAEAFARYVARQGTKTDRALYAAYLGSPQRGVDEVQAVLVDGTGHVVWKDRQRPGDKEFERVKPRNPMGCTQLLLGRLRDPLHLEDPFRKDAPEGRMAKRFQRESGIPDDAERAAMKTRVARLREMSPRATVTVYPVRINNEYSAAAATDLAGRAKDVFAARAADAELRFDFTPSMNEQKVLWSAARSIQAALRKSPADTDYALVAHYMVRPDGKGAFAVHWFLLDRGGDYVVVDFQNSHHGDFRRVDPKTADDCAKLAAVRLAGYLK